MQLSCKLALFQRVLYSEFLGSFFGELFLYAMLTGPLQNRIFWMEAPERKEYAKMGPKFIGRIPEIVGVNYCLPGQFSLSHW